MVRLVNWAGHILNICHPFCNKLNLLQFSRQSCHWGMEYKMVRTIPPSWPGLIEKCHSLFSLGYFGWSDWSDCENGKHPQSHGRALAAQRAAVWSPVHTEVWNTERNPCISFFVVIVVSAGIWMSLCPMSHNMAPVARPSTKWLILRLHVRLSYFSYIIGDPFHGQLVASADQYHMTICLLWSQV